MMVLMGCTSGKFSEYFLFMVLFTDLNFITNGLSSGFEVVSFVGEGLLVELVQMVLQTPHFHYHLTPSLIDYVSFFFLFFLFLSLRFNASSSSSPFSIVSYCFLFVIYQFWSFNAITF